MIRKKNIKNNSVEAVSYKHSFHLVDPSPWPFVAALSAFMLTFGTAMYLHAYLLGYELAIAGLLTLIFTMAVWWRDVIREATFEGRHTIKVQLGLRFGVILFILTEIMFFFGFFWAFFHASLSPNIEIGGIWPPKGINVLSAWDIPFVNTLILLTSGFSVTLAHEYIRLGYKQPAEEYLIVTILLAFWFTCLQLFEYKTAAFSINDGIYGSTFYMATGFHGFHVIVGTIFLTVCLYRLKNSHFFTNHHFGFEAAAWYWHFVDVVWLFLFVSIYWWGGA